MKRNWFLLSRPSGPSQDLLIYNRAAPFHIIKPRAATKKSCTEFPPKSRYCKSFASLEACRFPKVAVLLQPDASFSRFMWLVFPVSSSLLQLVDMAAPSSDPDFARGSCMQVCGNEGMNASLKEREHLQSMGKLQKKIMVMWTELLATKPRSKEAPSKSLLLAQSKQMVQTSWATRVSASPGLPGSTNMWCKAIENQGVISHFQRRAALPAQHTMESSPVSTLCEGGSQRVGEKC